MHFRKGGLRGRRDGCKDAGRYGIVWNNGLFSHIDICRELGKVDLCSRVAGESHNPLLAFWAAVVFLQTSSFVRQFWAVFEFMLLVEGISRLSNL